MIPKIPGDRIILRQLAKSDAKDLHRYCKNKDILRHTGIPHKPYELRHAERFIKQTHSAHRKKTAFHYGIENRDTRKIVGVISLFDVNKTHKSGEIG